jgi:hypothetical protein
MPLLRTNQRGITAVSPHPNSGRYFIPGGFVKTGSPTAGGFSQTALDVLARYPTLTDAETNAIGTFVDAEIAASNWAEYDDLFPFFIQDSASSLIGMKHMVSLDHLSAVKAAGSGGWDMGLTGYMDTQTVAAAPYVLNSGCVGTVYSAGPDDVTVQHCIGARLNATTDIHTLEWASSANGFTQTVHASGITPNNGPGAYPLGVVMASVRTASNATAIWRDGAVQVNDNDVTNTGIPTVPFFVCAMNANGNPARAASGAVVSFAFMSSGLIDLAAQNTNVKAMLAAV